MDMKKNNHVERRIAFLEKVYLEDRARWKASDRLFQHLLARQADHDRRFDEHARRMDEMQQSINTMQQSINSQLKILRRMMER